MTTERPVCPDCGTRLPADAPAGLCARCVFERMAQPAGPEIEPGSAPASLPRTFGEYDLLDEIARGGMGIIYRARQLRLNRLVAVKVLAAGEFSSPDFRARFRTEAEAAANLDHPHIIPIYEVGEQDDRPFLSMKLVDGQNLAERLGNAPMGNREAARLMIALARAVHYAHQRGILHRDLKPNNVLLDADGQPHLTDFGLAKLMEKESTITKTAAVLGTPSYMSPEQAAGHTKGLSTSVDVWGLGAILYELLTAQPPFAGGTTMATVRQVIENDPRRPTQLNPRASRDLEVICLKCLQKEPSRRYASADAVADDLQRWLNHEPIRARPASAWEKISKLVRRRPALAGLATALTLVAVLGLAGIIWQSEHRKLALTEARRALYALQMNLVRQAWEAGNTRRAGDLLDSLRPVGGAEDLRGFDWRYFWRLAADESLAILSMAVTAQDIALSSDGATLAIGLGSRGIELFDVATWERLEKLARPPAEAGSRSIAFSPDGRFLAQARTSPVITFWDLSTREPAFTINAHGPTVERIAFSPNGRWLAAASRPTGAIEIWDVSDRRLVHSIGPGPNDRPSIAFTPDGSRLVYGAADRTVRIISLADFTESAPLTGHEAPIVFVASSSDSRYAASSDAQGVVILWDLEFQHPVGTLSGHSTWVSSVTFSPDGRLLATTCVDGTIKIWDTSRQSELTTLRGHTAWVNRALFTPDGRYLISGSDDGTARIWNVPEEGVTKTHDLFYPWTDRAESNSSPPSKTGGIAQGSAEFLSNAMAFSPDGQHILLAGHDQTLALIDVASRRRVATLEGHHDHVNAVIYDPGGSWFASGGRDRTVRIWESRSLATVRILDRQARSVHALALSRDGRALAIGQWDGVISIVDPQMGTLRTVIQSPATPLLFIAFSADGRTLFSSGDLSQSILQWDVATGRLRRTLREHAKRIFDIDLSPDGRLLASASADQVLIVREANAGRPLAYLRGHTGWLTSVAFSPDGRTLASCGNDGTMRLWSVTASREVAILPGKMAPASATAFSPDGTVLVAYGNDKSLRIWHAPSFAETDAVALDPASRLRGH